MLIPFGVFSAAGSSVPSDYELIATTIVTSAGTVGFNSIPQTYKHLQLRITSRSNTSTNQSLLGMQFNNDGAGNYGYGFHYLKGNGSSVSSGVIGGTGYPLAFSYNQPGTSISSNIYAAGIIDILDYTNTNKNKTIRSFGGMAVSSYNEITLSSGLWLSTAAITSLVVLNQSSPYQIDSGSRLSLYGVK